jgi:hypothetical protein
MAININPHMKHSRNWILWENSIGWEFKGDVRILTKNDITMMLPKHHVPTSRELIERFGTIVYIDKWGK